jgi:PhnB protein
MPRAVSPVPEDFRTITPHIVVRGVASAVDFYGRAFGARELLRHEGPDGQSIMHCEMLLGDSRFFLVDENSEWGAASPLALGGTAVTLHLYVREVDAAYERAIGAGVKVLMPLQDCFWGDRYALVEDPFGHRWSMASRIEDLSPGELGRRSREWNESGAGARGAEP